MASYPLPKQVADVLGASALQALSEQHLQRLVGASESAELEVKRDMYGSGDSDKRELAADLAAMANASGGVLIIGASETNDVIDALTPIDVTGAELRVRQVVSNLVTPALEMETRVVPSDADATKGYVVVVVPRSVRAPHAVAVNRDLRFVSRDGPGKRPMGESEVADRYRSRFSAATGRLERLRAIHGSGEGLLNTDGDRAWLVIAGLPEVTGHGRSSRAEQAATRDWVVQSTQQTPLVDRMQSLANEVSPGYRRFVAGDWKLREDGRAQWCAAEFHHDGGSVVAVAVGHNWNRDRSQEVEVLTIADETMSFGVVSALQLVGSHAARRGGAGQIDIVASLASGFPVQLGHSRGFADQLGTRTLSDFERLTHTLALSDLVEPGPELVGAAYMVATDLIAGFGFAEALQMDLEGNLLWQYVGHGYRQEIGRWADRYGITILNRN